MAIPLTTTAMVQADKDATAIDQQLRIYRWYNSVGIGGNPHCPVLFVYLKSGEREWQAKAIAERITAHPVVLKIIGKVRAV